MTARIKTIRPTGRQPWKPLVSMNCLQKGRRSKERLARNCRPVRQQPMNLGLSCSLAVQTCSSHWKSITTLRRKTIPMVNLPVNQATTRSSPLAMQSPLSILPPPSVPITRKITVMYTSSSAAVMAATLAAIEPQSRVFMNRIMRLQVKQLMTQNSMCFASCTQLEPYSVPSGSIYSAFYSAGSQRSGSLRQKKARPSNPGPAATTVMTLKWLVRMQARQLKRLKNAKPMQHMDMPSMAWCQNSLRNQLQPRPSKNENPIWASAQPVMTEYQFHEPIMIPKPKIMIAKQTLRQLRGPNPTTIERRQPPSSLIFLTATSVVQNLVYQPMQSRQYSLLIDVNCELSRQRWPTQLQQTAQLTLISLQQKQGFYRKNGMASITTAAVLARPITKAAIPRAYFRGKPVNSESSFIQQNHLSQCIFQLSKIKFITICPTASRQ